MGERGGHKTLLYILIYIIIIYERWRDRGGVRKTVSVSVIVSGVSREPEGVPKNTCLVYVVATSVRISSVIS